MLISEGMWRTSRKFFFFFTNTTRKTGELLPWQGQTNSTSHRSGKESVCFLPVILKLKKSSIPCQTFLDLGAENL